MICPNCGKDTTGKFCPYCGSALSGANPVTPNEARSPRIQNVPSAAQGSAPNPVPAYSPAPAVNQTPPQTYAQPQSYAQGYAPQQGYNPAPQARGDYAQSPLGETPARQLVRRLATSPAFVIAALALTIQFVLLVLRCIDVIPKYLGTLKYYRGIPEIEGRTIGALIGISLGGLFSLIMLLAVWVTFGSADNRRNTRMSTGGLTTFKVISVLAVIGLSLLLVGLIGIAVILLIEGQNGKLFVELNRIIRDLLAQYRVDVDLPAGNLDVTVLLIVIAVLLLAVVLSLIYYARTVKSLNTGKRVINGGYPDDRVSGYVGVFTILIALVNGASGVSSLLDSAASDLLDGASLLLGAVTGLCFAIVLFKFRSGMRKLGVYKGLRQV